MSLKNVIQHVISLRWTKEPGLEYLSNMGLSGKELESVEAVYEALKSKEMKIEDMDKFFECISTLINKNKIGKKKGSNDWSYRFCERSIKNSETFIKFANQVFDKKEKICYWFSKFDMGSIKNVNELFCHQGFDLLDENGARLPFSWYHRKIYDFAIKDFNEIVKNKDINLLDDNGQLFDFSWNWYLLDDQSIKDWDEVCNSPSVTTKNILRYGYLADQWCCKFSEPVLEQAVKKGHFQSCYLNDKLNKDKITEIEKKLQKEQSVKTVSDAPKQETQVGLIH